MNKALVSDIFQQAGVVLREEQADRFAKYGAALVKWNKQINLTAIQEEEGIVVKHFVDSVLAMKSQYWTGRGTLLDLGTGAGFPGLPLKIICPELSVVLVDSLKKRVAFLEHIIAELQLQKIEAIHGRAEQLGREARWRERFDCVVSRAVAKMPVLLEYCLPFLKVGGWLMAYKGPAGREELRDAEQALQLLGGEIIETNEHCLPGGAGTRIIIVVEKIKATSAQYPRKPGVPEKKPL